MKVIREYPPNYKDIVESIPDVENSKTVVFTYGDKIYAPRVKGKIRKDVRVHEEQHARQQGDDPAGWWSAYLKDLEFRLSQEVDAYRTQYMYFVRKNHDIEKRKQFLQTISAHLSGPLYGNLLNQAQAVSLIITMAI